jgi:hypothetical protein
MPALASEFRAAIGTALGIAEAGETIRAVSPARSTAHRELTLSRLEALHEMAYLRIFVRWENFVEGSFLRMMCGYHSDIYAPTFLPGKSRHSTLRSAQAALFQGKDYLLWHNPKQLTGRSQAWFVEGPHEIVALSSYTRLEWFAFVRHRIAHGSKDAQHKANAATIGLCGRRYPGSSAGRFLRDWNTAATPPQRWLHTIGDELASLASQIAP